MKILPTDNAALYKMDDDLDTSVSSLTDSVQPRPLTEAPAADSPASNMDSTQPQSFTDTSAASTTASNADSPTPGMVPNTPPADPASNADSPTPGMVPNTPPADPASNESLIHAVPLTNTPATKPISNANSARPRPLSNTPAANSTASTVLFPDTVVSGLSNSQPEDLSPHAVPVALVDPFADGVITKHLDDLPRAASHAAKALISPVATMAISQALSLPSDPLQPDVISSTSQASAVPPATTISSSQIPSVLSSISASGSGLAATASTTAVIPPAEAIPHQPLVQTQNSTTDATRPAKKTKMECPAVVGPRLTEKNLAKAAWLAENPGGSGPDFEAHYKTLTPEEKKNFAAQAKIAQKAARLEKRAKAKNGQS
ncbi:hypothetical protein LshimejAT787_0110320 [Lyophyllum shimeji]|uniref:Uncharacterized protein n=1 Tax=Lyophyllum shimeji TaxID=47721 RepID=A0A9P3UIA8_LYOSH|nr:hypothetical protein LshimejAT787_0110320 [Lyophyllum shimeji]